MILTFDKNKFVLQKEFGVEETRDIKKAARFREYADAKAEKIFNTLMLRKVTIPSGGLPTPKDLKLLDFQAEQGVPFILGRNRSYLAHSPGLGKSAQAITAVSKKPGKTLIICPSFLTVTWAREITKWFIKDYPYITVVKNKVETSFDGDFVICSDAMLEKEWVQIFLTYSLFRFVFIDEGHRFKTPGANRTTALFGGRNKKIKSKGLIYNSEHVCALSGTPMLNRPIELWAVLYAMAPETIDFMTYEEFGFRYCGATYNGYGYDFLGSRNEDELKKRIMGKFMQRIRKEDVLPDLPEKMREVIVMDEDPRKKDVIEWDKELLTRFQKKREKVLDLGEYAKLRHINGVSKVKWVSNFVAGYLENDPEESIILYAHHRDVVHKLCAALAKYKPLVINGGVSSSARTHIEDQFQRGERRLLIGNIDSMNLGLTLTRATRVVFCEYSWTPALNEQAEDRANRIGSKWCVFCQYVVLPNSIDEDILNSNIIKEERIFKTTG